MNSRTCLIASAIAISSIALAGCAQLKLHPAFGDALHKDLAMQVIPPARDANTAAVPSSGDRAALAQERYATDTTLKPSAGAASAVKSESGNAMPAPK